jgi:tRNA threonylcarbamoyladenosine biosynthesis protein TsaB
MSEPRAPGAERAAPVILAFDTAGSACSVAVARGETVLAHERREMRHGHAEALLPTIDRSTAAAGLMPGEIDIVAVSTGPGGFTGIRAGLAAAQGLALATGARLVGITSFAAVAALVPAGRSAVLVTLDSRREDLYIQFFDADGDPCSEPAAVLPDDLRGVVALTIGDAPLRVAGDAAEHTAAALGGRHDVALIEQSTPDALGVLAAARARPDTSGLRARALYLRPPDVSFPKTRGIGGAA